MFRLGPGLLNIALIFGFTFVIGNKLFRPCLHKLQSTFVVGVVNVVCVYVVFNAVFRNPGSAGALVFFKFGGIRWPLLYLVGSLSDPV